MNTLEHARVMIFHNDGKEKVFISSADWMVRNIDHRIEAAVPIFDKAIKNELKDIINIQLKDNVKARWLESSLSNNYVPSGSKKKVYVHRLKSIITCIHKIIRK